MNSKLDQLVAKLKAAADARDDYARQVFSPGWSPARIKELDSIARCAYLDYRVESDAQNQAANEYRMRFVCRDYRPA